MRVKQLIAHKFCLKCDGCCRFSQANTVWAPLFVKSEIKYLIKENFFSLADFSNIAGRQRLQPLKHKDYFICPCFNPINHLCKIYKNRPFECQLYPFLLVKKDDKFYLAQDDKCLYISVCRKEKLSRRTAYLEKKLNQKQTISFLKQNKELFNPLESYCLTGFTEYPASELKLLFPINI